MSTASVLELMTASVVQGKIAAGAKLTPVGIEGVKITGPALPHTPATFPNDVPDEALLQRVSILEELFARIATLDEQQEELRRQVHAQYAGIREAMDAVKGVLTPATEVTAPTPEETKAKERAADARVAEANAQTDDEEERPQLAPEAAAVLVHMDQKAAEAQAATFAEPELPIGGTIAGQWSCPDHNTYVDKLSRLNRAYRACPTAGCRQFEKL